MSTYTKRLQHTTNGHNKFWNVTMTATAPNAVTVDCHWGKIGTAGMSKTFRFTSWDEANDFARGKYLEKLDKGYVELP